jgi:hypothetical protein
MREYFHEQRQFHTRYKFHEETLSLKGNSANAKFCILRPNNSPKNFIVKIQVTKENDPIVNDSIMNYALNANIDDKYLKYFMQIHGSFWAQIDDDNYYIRRPTSKDVKVRPAVVVQEVEDPLPLCALLNHPVEFRSMFPKLGNFIHCLLDVAQEIGFAHHDMHTGNILYNTKDKHFVLIDYGRVHIPRMYDENYIRQDDLENFISVEMQKFGREFHRYFQDPYSFPITMRNPKTCYDGKELYILNDIAGLCFTISSELSINFKDTVNNLLKAIENENTNRLSKLMTMRNFFADLVATPQGQEVFAMLIGLVWFVALANEYNKYIKFDRDAERLFIRRKKYYCLVNPNAFSVIKCNMLTFFNTTMKSLIRAWKNFRGSTMDGGRDVLNRTDINDNFIQKNIDQKIQDIDGRSDIIKTDKLKIVQQKTKDIDAEPVFYEDDKPFSMNIKPHSTMLGDEYFKIVALRDADILELSSRDRRSVALTVGGKVKPEVCRKICVDKSTRRKYIKLSNKKWYLDEHRGKYKYSVVNGVKDFSSIVVK